MFLMVSKGGSGRQRVVCGFFVRDQPRFKQHNYCHVLQNRRMNLLSQ